MIFPTEITSNSSSFNAFKAVLENGFKAKWNLENDKIWAINPSSFEEVGCIHTAQGLEFDYVGVFIGKDLSQWHLPSPDSRYKDGCHRLCLYIWLINFADLPDRQQHFQNQ